MEGIRAARPADGCAPLYYGHTLGRMATMTIKSTFSLDVDTARRLEELARCWNVSKSAALRRAIRAASAQTPSRSETRRRALRALQRSVASRGVDLAAWEREAAEIRAGSFPRLGDDPR